MHDFLDNLANDQYRKMHEERKSDDIEWDIEEMKRAIIETEIMFTLSRRIGSSISESIKEAMRTPATNPNSNDLNAPERS